MATSQQILDQATLVEVLSREVDGANDLISSIASIDTWTVVCFVLKGQIDSLINDLQAAKNLVNGDPLRQGVLIFNTSQDNTIAISTNQVDAVGDHLKGVFLPAARDSATLQRDAAIDTLNDLKNEPDS